MEWDAGGREKVNRYEAVASRWAVRAFKDEPVSREVLERVLSAATSSRVRETAAEALSPSDGLVLFCGMSIEYEDPLVSAPRTGCAPLAETVTFVGG